MKLRTNLSAATLDKIAKGIKVAADKKRQKPYAPENNAETEMLRKMDMVFDTMLDSLQEDIAGILLEKE